MTIEILGKAKDRGVSRAELRLCADEQELAHKNAVFKQATPEQRRVIIAKDVLAWLKEKKLHATPGTYLSSVDFTTVVDGEYKSLRVEEDRVDGGGCSACALGGLFACMVENTGGLQDFWRHSDQDRIRTKLAPYFDERQLAMIETAFEHCYFSGEGATSIDLNAAYRFGEAFDAGARRMRAIMRNIIRNNGTFKP